MSASVLGGRLPMVLGAIAGLIVFFGIPVSTDQFQTFQFANVAVFAIAIMGLNILVGYSGQISLGNGAFMAVGGYTTALMVARLGVPYSLTIPLGGLLAALAGFLVGIPALRLRGIYLALATFALALTVTPVGNNFDSFTGGHAGINLRPAAPPLGLDLSNEQWLYFVSWAIAALLFVPALLLVRSRTGRAWMAIRESETAAAANGIDVAFYKTLAFAVSAFYAGVAGALQIVILTYVNPDNYNLALSLQLLVGIVIGGLGYSWGPIVGGLLVVWLPYFAELAARNHYAIGPFVFPDKPDVGFGLLLLLVVFLAPTGVAGLVESALQRYRRARRRAREQVIGEQLEGAPPQRTEADEMGT